MAEQLTAIERKVADATAPLITPMDKLAADCIKFVRELQATMDAIRQGNHEHGNGDLIEGLIAMSTPNTVALMKLAARIDTASTDAGGRGEA